MLRRPAGLPPDDFAWAYEMKWDGLRAIAEIDHGPCSFGHAPSVTSPPLPGLQRLAAAAGVDQAVLYL